MGREVVVVVESVKAVGYARQWVAIGLGDDVQESHVDCHAVKL
jgi:hypothetical protein